MGENGASIHNTGTDTIATAHPFSSAAVSPAKARRISVDPLMSFYADDVEGDGLLGGTLHQEGRDGE